MTPEEAWAEAYCTTEHRHESAFIEPPCRIAWERTNAILAALPEGWHLVQAEAHCAGCDGHDTDNQTERLGP